PPSVTRSTRPSPMPACCRSCRLFSMAAAALLPWLGMMSVDRLPISAAIVSLSVVSGVTVNALPEYTTSAVWPLCRCSSTSSTLSLARASRLGETSSASIDRDRSSAITIACPERYTGCSMRSQAGPASAMAAMLPPQPKSHQRQSMPCSRPRASTCGCSAGSLTVSQLPGRSRRRAAYHANAITSGTASSHSGRRKWNSAGIGPHPPEHGPGQAGEQGTEREQPRERERAAERPVVQRLHRPEPRLRLGDRLELVEQAVDLLQRGGVARAEVMAAGHGGDARQRRLVEVGGRVDAAQEPGDRGHHHLVGADADRVHAQADVGGELRGLQGIDRAGGVRAVGQQDQYLLAGLGALLVQALHRERDRVADRRLLAGEPDERFHEQRGDGVAVQRERRLQVRPLAEQDEADAIALAAADEVGGDRLGGGQAIDAPAAELEVLRV